MRTLMQTRTGLMAWLLPLLLSSALAHGSEYSPRVVSPHNADAHSMRTFAEFHRDFIGNYVPSRKVLSARAAASLER